MLKTGPSEPDGDTVGHMRSSVPPIPGSPLLRCGPNDSARCTPDGRKSCTGVGVPALRSVRAHGCAGTERFRESCAWPWWRERGGGSRRDKGCRAGWRLGPLRARPEARTSNGEGQPRRRVQSRPARYVLASSPSPRSERLGGGRRPAVSGRSGADVASAADRPPAISVLDDALALEDGERVAEALVVGA
jgi:hypothetical protein